ncbi:hypothetical protein BKA67DRAFT_670045 [Truncatella angustata]|uniref:Uncharacterized protein n=1 Tax=Truncatella angustata TaxID=152316 RepID=A0A9P8UBP2_9PEZI|nr:uncharacterized protein BKA67DRAFT_670045 [Truncatella angustata]KAH6645651.1 hypothetical protein BKA67DRAFT_670045 [Truncatella angustata]
MRRLNAHLVEEHCWKRCKYCSAVHTEASSQRHLEQTHDLRKCEVCGELIEADDMIRHLRSTHAGRICRYCIHANTEKGLADHISRFHAFHPDDAASQGMRIDDLRTRTNSPTFEPVRSTDCKTPVQSSGKSGIVSQRSIPGPKDTNVRDVARFCRRITNHGIAKSACGSVAD